MNSISIPVNLPDFSGLDLDFDIVDSHHHLFDLDAVYYPWLTDRPEKKFLLGNYDSIKKNYSCDDYRKDTEGLKISKTVHVEAEADHDHPVRETEWLERVRVKEGMPNAIVAHCWLNHKNSEETLLRLAAIDGVRGIRIKPVTSTSARKRSEVLGQTDSMGDPSWREGLGLLRKYDLSWDLRVPYWHLVEAAEVCSLYPDLPIVVEHTGLPWDRDEEGISEWRSGMKKLASLPNVYVKISELGLAVESWDYIDNRMIVREAIEIFGFERSMFASNFPVASLRISYSDQVSAIASMIIDCSLDERSKLFHDTANTFYRL